MAGDAKGGHAPAGFADNILKAGIGLALFVGAAAIVIWFVMWLFGAIPARQTYYDPPAAPVSSRASSAAGGYVSRGPSAQEAYSRAQRTTTRQCVPCVGSYIQDPNTCECTRTRWVPGPLPR